MDIKISGRVEGKGEVERERSEGREGKGSRYKCGPKRQGRGARLRGGECFE